MGPKAGAKGASGVIIVWSPRAITHLAHLRAVPQPRELAKSGVLSSSLGAMPNRRRPLKHRNVMIPAGPLLGSHHLEADGGDRIDQRSLIDSHPRQPAEKPARLNSMMTSRPPGRSAPRMLVRMEDGSLRWWYGCLRTCAVEESCRRTGKPFTPDSALRM